MNYQYKLNNYKENILIVLMWMSLILGFIFMINKNDAGIYLFGINMGLCIALFVEMRSGKPTDLSVG